MEGQGGVVELELLERGAQVFKVLRCNGVDTGKDHRLDFLEAFDTFTGGAGHMGDGVADSHLFRGLNTRDDIAYIAGTDLLTRAHLELQGAHLVGVVLATGSHELDHIAAPNHPVYHLEIGDNSPEGVEDRVEDEALQRRVGITLGGRDPIDHGVQHFRHAQARLSAGTKDGLAGTADEFNDLVFNLLRLGAREVDFVDHRDDLEVIFDGHVEVRDRLGLNALCGVDHQQCALAGGNGTRDFIREIDMPGRVDQVQHPFFVPICIVHLDRMALDGDSALAFEIHIVEHLGLHVFGGDRLGVLEQSISECTLPMVDVGDDAEVAYVVHIVECSLEGMISARKSKIGYGL